jgi:plasmid rolling circle replication initiator protein Rep
MQTREVKFLVDKYITRKGKEKERPWRSNKKMSTLLAESYLRIEEISKAARVKQCGAFLDFKKFPDGTKKLDHANFCKARLCPMCAWRRSRKVYGQTSKIMDYFTEHYEYEYVFLTVTFRNMSGNDLPKAIDDFMEGFNRMTKTKEFKKLSKGFFRALEVRKNFNREDFHPHMHVIIAVGKSYFHKGGASGYLSHEGWKELWRKCANLDYDPWVYIEKIKPDDGEKTEGERTFGGAVAEVSKYCTKGTDFIKDPDEIVYCDTNVKVKDMSNTSLYEQLKKMLQDYTDEMVFILDGALKGRRLISYGGKFKEVHRLLNLDDPTEGDLINADCEKELNPELEYVMEHYRWGSGYMNYIQYEPEENY